MTDKTELEATLLNTILTYSEGFNQIIGLIQSENIFDKPEHIILFRDALKYFSEKGKVPNLYDIYEMQILTRENRDSSKEYLTKVLPKCGTEIKEISKLAKKIIEMKAEKEFKDYLGIPKELGFDYIQAISDKALEITSKYLSGCRKAKSNYEIADSVITKIMNGVGNNFIKSGFDKIDKYTNGIPKSHLTIVAGRPGTGKTTFMLQLMRNLIRQNLKVGIFSLEMTAESLFIKNLSSATSIDSLKIESNDLTVEEKEQLADVALHFCQDNYMIIDNSIQTPTSIKAQINLWKINNQVDIVLLDYLTLVTTDYKQIRQDLEIGKLSGELNAIAKITGIPIVILSQLNRQSEARADKRPQLSDLRESGSIEQDANLVLLLHRPALFGLDGMNKDYKYTTQDGQSLSKEEYFEVIIAKARNGRTGNVSLRYRPEIHTMEPVIIERFAGERLSRDYEEILKTLK